MYCPKCGGENHEDAQVCTSCGVLLAEADERQPRAKTSRLAILSLVLGILSLFLFVLTGIPAIIIGIIGQLKIRRSSGTLKGKYVAFAGMNASIVFMVVFYILWSRDAPPIPSDYTVADLRSAPVECAESFEILKTLIDEDWKTSGAPAIGLSDGDMDMIAEIRGVLQKGTATEIAQILSRDSTDIKAAWVAVGKARDVIHRLNKFPEIADLTEPGLDSKIMRWGNLVELAHLYEVQAHLQIEEGDIHAFAAELIDLDSMFRKLSVNVRPTIGKAVCLKCIELDILTANVILNNPGSLKKSIELLAQHFTPVAMEQMSLRNAILSEYFLLKDIVSKMPDFNAAGKTPLFKSNSTLRLYRNFYCDWLDAMEGDLSIAKVQLSVWPDIYPFTEPSLSLNNHKPLPLLYKFYNPLVIVVGPRYDAKMLGRHPVTRTQIQDDLFQMILNKRLGREVSLKARAYSDKYIVDVENRKIFSPGPDGEAGTKDDIEMRINPEVLGWGNQE